jgi:prepilin-type N-terminal cleavage/methylation domain-containing protein
MRGSCSGGRRRDAGFTMIEIAIAIAVVAFALVAIIGVMPTGLRVQQENREDTVVNQDGNVWLQAIRSGALGLNYLTNHIELIEVRNQVGNLTSTNLYTVVTYERGEVQGDLRDGRDIVGILSTPRYQLDRKDQWTTNLIRAYVRAISGAAADRLVARPGGRSEFGFLYRMTVEVVPHNPVAGMATDVSDPNLPAEVRTNRLKLLAWGNSLQANLFDVRVAIDWPVTLVPNQPPRIGNNRREFRTLVSGTLTATNSVPLRRPLYFLQPNRFAPGS